MQLYYIRHAQSVNNAIWEATGGSDGRSSDPELTEVGYQQSHYLAQFLKRSNSDYTNLRWDGQNRAGFGITHLYCSLMVRAIATGREVAGELCLPLHALEDIHEEGGIYLRDAADMPIGQPGHDRSYFQTCYPELILPESVNPTGWWHRPFETHELRRERARRVIADLLDRHGRTDHRVAWVSHGGFFYQFLSALYDLSEPDSLTDARIPGPIRRFEFALNNASITRFDFTDQEIILVYLNRVDFLPPELVT